MYTSLRTRARHFIYIRTTLYSLATAITAYIHSSFLLSAGLSNTQVNAVYIGLSIISICIIWLLVGRKRRLRTYNVLILLCTICIAGGLAGVLWGSSSTSIVASLFVFLGLEAPMFYMLDELLEHETTDGTTGRTRSWFLVVQNMAWVLAPLVGFNLVGSSNSFEWNYIAAFCIIIALLILQTFSLAAARRPSDLTMTNSLPFEKKVLPGILAHFSLHLFYVVMVITSIIYMHETLQFAWSTIGIIMTCALCAFPLVQLPLGRILDKFHIEKYCIPTGLIIMSISVLLFSWSNILTPVTCFLVLFLSRIGAAMTEVSDESFIFKHIKFTNRSTIAVFRSLSPLAYLCTPLLLALVFAVDFETLYTAFSVLLAGVALCITIMFTWRQYRSK